MTHNCFWEYSKSWGYMYVTDRKRKRESLEMVWYMHMHAYKVIILFPLQCSSGQAEGTQDWKCE